MKHLLENQYLLVQSSRKVLLDYCDNLGSDEFKKVHAGFGNGGSIRNLLVHIANTYQHWVGVYGLQKNILFTPYEKISSASECGHLFLTVDEIVGEFLEHFKDDYFLKMSAPFKDITVSSTPLQVFTHVITHEFHHKGQILSIGRQSGYLPVDTDVIR